MNKRAAIMIAAAAVLLVLCGCESIPAAELTPSFEMGSGSAPAATFAPEVYDIVSEYNSSQVAVSAPAEESDVYAPVTVSRTAYCENNCCVVYPALQGTENAEAINASMRENIMAKAAELNVAAFTDYRVEYNRNGIFSIRVFIYGLYDPSGTCLGTTALNYDVTTGRLCRISDLFDKDDQYWRGRIPDMITYQAQESDILLLSELLPIDDDREFYITDDCIVIMYNKYEISTASAGEPEFEIQVEDVREYVGDDSVLNVFISPTATPALDGSAEPQPEQSTDVQPTLEPTIEPTIEPTPMPTIETIEPTAEPTPEPTIEPTPVPVNEAAETEQQEQAEVN